jgi:hypothetical protein
MVLRTQSVDLPVQPVDCTGGRLRPLCCGIIMRSEVMNDLDPTITTGSSRQLTPDYQITTRSAQAMTYVGLVTYLRCKTP